VEKKVAMMASLNKSDSPALQAEEDPRVIATRVDPSNTDVALFLKWTVPVVSTLLAAFFILISVGFVLTPADIMHFATNWFLFALTFAVLAGVGYGCGCCNC
jgi:hypothetical protein